MASKDKTKSDMWASARLIWESSPDISFRDLIDRLVEVYGVNMAPTSASTVSRRAKKEGWNKIKMINGGEKRNNTQRNSQKGTESAQQGTQQGIISATKMNKANSGGALTAYATTRSKLDDITESVIMSTEDKKRLIVKHRRRLRQAGDLQDRVIDNQIEILNLVEQPEADPGTLQKLMVVNADAARTLKVLTESQKTIAEQEFIICGISPDDFQQSEQDRRLGALEAMQGIEEQERDARNRLKPKLYERMSWITEVEQDLGNADDIMARHGVGVVTTDDAEIIEDDY